MSHCHSLSRESISRLISSDPRLASIQFLSPADLAAILHVNTAKANLIHNEIRKVPIDSLMELYQSQNISFIPITSTLYPSMLKEIYDPPLLLFAKGDASLFNRQCLAVVGARDARGYAGTALDLLLPELVSRGIVIASGLAKGTDTIAHEKTIRLQGKTIAVLAGGFFHVYPRENRTLAEEMAQEHLLISEYPPVFRPQKWHFPMRNRIISGIAKGTLIVQAKKKSGSLITADRALEEGREVFAVPGPIGFPLSEGTNHLIQQGAKLVMNAEDILAEID